MAAGSTKVGRNDRCRCGSGKKYKNCCENKDRSKMGLASWLTISVVVTAAAVIVYFVFIAASEDGPRGARQCPPGTSWQHGHCHPLGG